MDCQNSCPWNDESMLNALPLHLEDSPRESNALGSQRSLTGNADQRRCGVKPYSFSIRCTRCMSKHSICANIRLAISMFFPKQLSIFRKFSVLNHYKGISAGDKATSTRRFRKFHRGVEWKCEASAQAEFARMVLSAKTANLRRGYG